MISEYAFHVAYNRQIRMHDSCHLGRIDIHVNHFGMRREGGQTSGDAVIEANTQGNQQVVRSCAMLAA